MVQMLRVTVGGEYRKPDLCKGPLAAPFSAKKLSVAFPDKTMKIPRGAMNRNVAVVWLFSASMLGGCSKAPNGNDSASASAAPSSSAVASASKQKSVTACDMVTAQEMSAIVGGEVVATPDDHSNGKTSCIYKTDKPITHTTPYVELSVDWGSGEGGMAASGALNKHEPGVADPYAGIGDQAAMSGPALMIKTGEDLMTIVLSGVNDFPATAKKIFDTAKPRLHSSG